MIEVPIYNQSGDKIDTIKVDPAKLGGEVRKAPRSSRRWSCTTPTSGRAPSARSPRGEVAGSTRKMFRQKGTGNARTGGIRNPIKKGGGHAKQKRPKDWRQAMPKKQRRLARDSAILAKLQSNDVLIVDEFKFDAPKTKPVAAMFKALGIERSCLLALPGRDENLEKSARNIDRTTLTTVSQLNAWDILKNRTLLLTKAGLEQILA
jgi:large subunit ribosomal protein L4